MAAGMMLGIGERIRSIAMTLAPVLTGDLARSIEMAISEAPNGSPMVEVGSRLRYAGFVEFGTSIPTPEQPYLRPALDEVV